MLRSRSEGIELGAEFDKLYIGLVSRETAGLYPGLESLLADLVRLRPTYDDGETPCLPLWYP